MTTLATGIRTAPLVRRRLLWSDYAFLFAVAVAAIVTVDPLEWGLAPNRVIKHLALMITVPAVVLTLIGHKLRAPWRRTGHVGEVVRVAWPLAVLAALIIGGSLYARLVGDTQNTFLNVGLYMLATFSAAIMVHESDAPEGLARGYCGILLVAALVMGVLLIVNYGVRQVYHEQIFLVIPVAALALAPAKRTFIGVLGGLFFLSMAWFSHKHTSYLIGALTAIYLVLVVALPRMGSRSPLYRATAAYWFALAMLGAVTLFGYAAMQEDAGLPSGNLEYRFHTYGAALERFKDSPVWGTLFTAEAVEKFRLYSIGIAGNMLPTHSDILDFLANGGVIAAGLLLWGLGRVGKVAYANLLAPRYANHPWGPYGHTLAMMSLAGVITYAFNPVLLTPSMAYLLWSNLGVLLGLSLRSGEASSAYAAGVARPSSRRRRTAALPS